MAHKYLDKIAEYDNKEFTQLIVKNGYKEYEEILIKQQVDGRTFLNLTELQLQKWLIPFASKRKLWKIFLQLRQNPQEFIKEEVVESKPTILKKSIFRSAQKNEIRERLENIIVKPPQPYSKHFQIQSRDDYPLSQSGGYLTMNKPLTEAQEAFYDESGYLEPSQKNVIEYNEENSYVPPTEHSFKINTPYMGQRKPIPLPHEDITRIENITSDEENDYEPPPAVFSSQVSTFSDVFKRKPLALPRSESLDNDDGDYIDFPETITSVPKLPPRKAPENKSSANPEEKTAHTSNTIMKTEKSSKMSEIKKKVDNNSLNKKKSVKDALINLTCSLKRQSGALSISDMTTQGKVRENEYVPANIRLRRLPSIPKEEVTTKAKYYLSEDKTNEKWSRSPSPDSIYENCNECPEPLIKKFETINNLKEETNTNEVSTLGQDDSFYGNVPEKPQMPNSYELHHTKNSSTETTEFRKLPLLPQKLSHISTSKNLLPKNGSSAQSDEPNTNEVSILNQNDSFYGNVPEKPQMLNSYDLHHTTKSNAEAIEFRKLPLPPKKLPHISTDKIIASENSNCTQSEEEEDAEYHQYFSNLNEEYFYRNTDRKGAKQLLQNLPEGAFLFRPNHNGNFFLVLSVKHRSRFLNLGITKTVDNKLKVDSDSDSTSPEFTTLTELVEYFTEEALTLKKEGNIIKVFLVKALKPNMF